MKRILLCVMMLVALAATAFAGQVADGMPRRNADSDCMGGVAPDGTQVPLHVTAGGSGFSHQTNRPVDDNGVQYLTTGIATLAPGAQFQTIFLPVKEFRGGMLQVAWTDTTGASAEQDSVALEFYLEDHLSQSGDGTFFFTDTDPSTPQLDGFFITSPLNQWAGNPALVKSSQVFYNKLTGAAKIATGSPGGTTADNGFYNISIPLATKQGASLLGNNLGLLIVNRSGKAVDNAIGKITGSSTIHNLSVALVLKAN